jgi:hypothetical protein
MRLLLLVSLLLFSAGFIYNEKAQAEEQETYYGKQQREALTAKIGEINISTEENSPYDAGKDWLYRLYLLFTIIGVVGAWCGIAVIYQQTKATAQAAQATERYVKLQETALRQWVKTRNWDARVTDPSNHPERLQIEFEIVNPTSAPITLMWTRLSTPGGNMAVGGFLQNAMLIPDHPYIIDVQAGLNHQQQQDYLGSSGLILPVDGSIAYTDALGDKWEQKFKLVLICSRPGTRTSEYIHTLHPIKNA